MSNIYHARLNVARKISQQKETGATMPPTDEDKLYV